MNIIQSIRKNYLNIPGWRTNRHIVVIESDDWGSIRMPSKNVYDKLLKAGIRVDKSSYCSNDTIATEDDLSNLFEVLCSVKDKNGFPAVLTANALVANPDFEKIKECGFEKYYYQLITEYIPNLNGCAHSLELWDKGQQAGCFRVQSHGREHLNVPIWMRYLQEGNKDILLAFELGLFGIPVTRNNLALPTPLPAFSFFTTEDEKRVNEIAADGLRLFEKIFGYRSKSFIAPNYTWGKSLETVLMNNGVKYIQGQQRAIYKQDSTNSYSKRIRRIGRTSSLGLMDITRNVIFEPSSNPNKNWVDSCLKEISNVFFWHHPAVICSHRVNYVGGINTSNRDNGLRSLSQLLQKIVKKWPDVEFMSSDQLGNEIING